MKVLRAHRDVGQNGVRFLGLLAPAFHMSDRGWILLVWFLITQKNKKVVHFEER